MRTSLWTKLKLWLEQLWSKESPKVHPYLLTAGQVTQTLSPIKETSVMEPSGASESGGKVLHVFELKAIWPMEIELAQLPETPFAKRGIYGKDKQDWPERMRYLYPEAALSILKFEHDCPDALKVSDGFRSMDDQLRARATRKGAQRPGSSAHNYGLALDIDVPHACKTLGVKRPEFLHLFQEYGWYCHRRDGMGGFESWHFNYMGPGNIGKFYKKVNPKNSKTWHLAAETRILDMYGDQLDLTNHDVQRALTKLGLYVGKIDGLIGEQSKAAIKAFQRTWLLPVDGVANPMTKRALACATAVYKYNNSNLH